MSSPIHIQMERAKIGNISQMPSKRVPVVLEDEVSGKKRISERKSLYKFVFAYEIQIPIGESHYKTLEGEELVFVKCSADVDSRETDDMAKEKFLSKYYSNDRILHSSIISKKKIY